MGAEHGRDLSMDDVSIVCVVIFSISFAIMMISCVYRYYETFEEWCGGLRCIGVCCNFCTSLTWGIWLVYTYANYLCHFNPDDICEPTKWNERIEVGRGRECSMHCGVVLWGGIGLLIIGLIELCCLIRIWAQNDICYTREECCCFCYFVRDLMKKKRADHDGHDYEQNIDIEIMVDDIDDTPNHFKLKKLDCELCVDLDDLRLLISAFIGDTMDIFIPLRITDLILNFHSMYSQIINKKKMRQSLKMMAPHPGIYELCYKASRDGFDSAAFHKKCDFKGQETITLIKTTDHQIIGGCTRSPWCCAQNESDNVVNKKDNFVFMCNKEWCSFVRHKELWYKYDDKNYGPSFGYNQDLLVTVSDSDKNMESRSILLSDKYFQSIEIEVFVTESNWWNV